MRDLPVSTLGVDVDNGFAPTYVTSKGKEKVISELRKAAAKADEIYLAPDPDREGEAIAWHIREALRGKKDDDGRFHRVLFNEITKEAVNKALENPLPVNQDRFESQQARRILDRLVGYNISPLLWDKVKRGLSAGRVQSVALRMIVDRERAIMAFKPQEYWSLTALLEGDAPPPFEAKLARVGSKKADLADQGQTMGGDGGRQGPNLDRGQDHPAQAQTPGPLRPTSPPPCSRTRSTGWGFPRPRPWPWPSSSTRASSWATRARWV